MKFIPMVVVVLAFYVSSALAVLPPNCFGQVGMARVYCRGKIGVATGGETANNGVSKTKLWFKFKKNPVKPGADGVDLQVGTCAYHDRVISTVEPELLFIDMATNDFIRLNGEVARDCLNDRDCVLEVCVENVDNPWLSTRVLQTAGHMMEETHYPKFTGAVVPPKP